jgi:hypothetical protein
VRIVSSFAAPQPPRVRLRYEVAHPTSDPIDATVRWSSDGGASWRLATPRPDFGSEPTTGLATSPAGEPHLFVWDAPTDLGGTEHTGLRLRVEVGPPPDGVADTTPFDTTIHLAPSVRIERVIASRTSPHVALAYRLSDEGGDLCRVRVDWSDDGGAQWYPATDAQGFGSDGTVGLTSSPDGLIHRFVWDAATDLQRPQARDLLLRVEALDAQLGGSDTSAPFHFGVNTPPEIRLRGAPAVVGNVRVIVPFELIDADMDMVTLTAAFRSATTPQPRPATPANVIWASPLTSLFGFPDGYQGLFVWEASADVVPGGADARGVIVRLEVSDGDPGNAVETAPFDVAAVGGGGVLVTYPTNGATLSAATPIHMMLVDAASRPMSISPRGAGCVELRFGDLTLWGALEFSDQG